jgi:hypothetical protein
VSTEEIDAYFEEFRERARRAERAPFRFTDLSVEQVDALEAQFHALYDNRGDDAGLIEEFDALLAMLRASNTFEEKRVGWMRLFGEFRDGRRPRRPAS